MKPSVKKDLPPKSPTKVKGGGSTSHEGGWTTNDNITLVRGAGRAEVNWQNVPSAMVLFRPIWSGVLISAGGFTGETADAAIAAGHADAIITFNAQDFPRPLLADEGLIRIDPDQLLCQLHDRHPVEVARVVADVHATAERMLGEVIPLKSLMKRAQLRRLGKALDATPNA